MDRASNPEQKRLIGERLWLRYYNEALFERGLITEDERNRMDNRIAARAGQIFPAAPR